VLSARTRVEAPGARQNGAAVPTLDVGEQPQSTVAHDQQPELVIRTSSSILSVRLPHYQISHGCTALAAGPASASICGSGGRVRYEEEHEREHEDT
jgi:hypothetical protein